MGETSAAARPSRTEVLQLVWFQGVMWLLLTAILVLPAFERRHPVDFAAVLRWDAAWTAIGIALSTLLGALLTRVPERFLRGVRAALVVLPLSVVAGVLWSLTLLALEPFIGWDPLAPPHVRVWPFVFFNSLRGLLVLGLWSALYLVNMLSLRMQRAREHAARVSAAASEAQLQLLRSQVHPHFLFNALNSVVALIGENPRRAQTMVRDVASLLRKALASDATRLVPFEEELEFVRLYLKCEEVRFEERLRVSFDVAPGLETLRVPPMLLHPLVENAVKHGMHAATSAPLSIRITAERSHGRLHIEVQNTGSLTPPRDDLLPQGSGIGLRNVRERLTQLFPDAHLLVLSERAGTVVARLELPTLEAA